MQQPTDTQEASRKIQPILQDRQINLHTKIGDHQVISPISSLKGFKLCKVCGLKKEVYDFYILNQLINRYDIVIFLKTFLQEEDEERILRKLVNFQLYFVFGTKMAGFGRFADGLLYMVNLIPHPSYTKCCLRRFETRGD